MKKIIISSDLLRIKNINGKLTSYNDYRIKKYYNLLKWDIETGSQKNVSYLSCDNTVSQKKLYSLLNLEYKNESLCLIFNKCAKIFQ